MRQNPTIDIEINESDHTEEQIGTALLQVEVGDESGDSW